MLNLSVDTFQLEFLNLFWDLTCRHLQVKVGTAISVARPINRGTIQGSGIGSTDYVVTASDLRALSRIVNKLLKYSDGTTLLVLTFHWRTTSGR